MDQEKVAVKINSSFKKQHFKVKAAFLKSSSLSSLGRKPKCRDNAGISGQPEGATPGHPGAFVTAAVTNTC